MSKTTQAFAKGGRCGIKRFVGLVSCKGNFWSRCGNIVGCFHWCLSNCKGDFCGGCSSIVGCSHWCLTSRKVGWSLLSFFRGSTESSRCWNIDTLIANQMWICSSWHLESTLTLQWNMECFQTRAICQQKQTVPPGPHLSCVDGSMPAISAFMSFYVCWMQLLSL